MTSEAVWIVIESVSPLEIPIMTYDHNKNSTISGSSLHLWNETQSFPMGLNPHKGIIPEPPNFLKPNNFPVKNSLSSIKLIGVFTNLKSAQAACGFSPNRKILGPTIVQ